ncbi:Superoxide-generating NADPH oxidase heavy chain subunit A [Phytophthora citrophthora]|uniref:Superoxide-generating NADPH oxidase heavy chain subunit A n=1 Tax=Phytophthora citrophthora TaxID=4793 RepID=A0AAD9LPZ7_9STRA|nr:Superoxide-generating NADPH oxidase heavy chain subunit A [Phytophthora citrophthora]
MSAVADSSTPSGDYIQSLESSNVQVPKDGNSPFACWNRIWCSIRWKLSRTIFSRPLPFLTATLDLKLGDILITLPVAALVLAVNTNLCAKEEVKESGSLPMIAMIVTFALAIRNNSILLTLTGLPFERVLFYHKFVGVVAILLTGLHGLAYLLEDAGVTAARRLRGGGDENLMTQQQSGAICFYLLCALLIFSLAPIRRGFYEGFLRMHWLLFIGIVVFAVIHGAGGVVIGFIPWVLDLIFRHGYLVQRNFRGGFTNILLFKKSGVISQEQVSMIHLPGNILRIQFPRVRADTGESFKYQAGQYVFICIPNISLLEWHPFTISSSPSEILVTIHIKPLGDWTKKLLTKIPLNSVVTAQIPILVDGSYGSVSIDIENPKIYAHVALFSGGIGITPMQAIANQLFFDFQHGRELKKVLFIWSVRERAMVEAMMNADFVEERKLLQGHLSAYLPDDLTSAGPNGGSTTPDDVFKAEFYLTQCQPDLENPIDRRLQHCMRYNTRPDIEDILKTLGGKAAKDDKQRVAVLVCGPSTLIRDVINISMKLQRSSKIKFDVHTECFEF